MGGLGIWVPMVVLGLLLVAGHSLNLVCQAAAESSPAAVKYYALLQEIYVFFTASTHRYEVLTQLVTLKLYRAMSSTT